MIDRILLARSGVHVGDTWTNKSVAITCSPITHQATGVPRALPCCPHPGITRPRRRRNTPFSWVPLRRFCSKLFKVEGLLAPRTRLNLSSISITRIIVLIPGLFFDLYWSRTLVFCCTSSVYTGITQNKLPSLTGAPREGCGSSPRTKVLGLGEVIECTSLVPGICCSGIPLPQNKKHQTGYNGGVSYVGTRSFSAAVRRRPLQRLGGDLSKYK
jgi:hypothetical protein